MNHHITDHADKPLPFSSVSQGRSDSFPYLRSSKMRENRSDRQASGVESHSLTRYRTPYHNLPEVRAPFSVVQLALPTGNQVPYVLHAARRSAWPRPALAFATRPVASRSARISFFASSVISLHGTRTGPPTMPMHSIQNFCSAIARRPALP